MESVASAKHVGTTARKARLVADAIKGRKVSEALSLLDLTIKKNVSGDFSKLVKAAVANMQSKHTETNVDVDVLQIKHVRVDQGATLKRSRAMAQGRSGRILKRMCHISLVISD